MANDLAYVGIPIQSATKSTSVIAQRGEHYVVCDSEAGDIEVSISGTPKYKYTFVNINPDYKVNFLVNGEVAVLSQYDSIIVQKPLLNSASLVINPTIGI